MFSWATAKISFRSDAHGVALMCPKGHVLRAPADGRVAGTNPDMMACPGKEPFQKTEKEALVYILAVLGSKLHTSSILCDKRRAHVILVSYILRYPISE